MSAFPLPSEIAHEEIQLLVEVRLEVEALAVALLDAGLLLGLEVHLIVAFDAGVRAAGDHRGEVLEDDARLQIFNVAALVGLRLITACAVHVCSCVP